MKSIKQKATFCVLMLVISTVLLTTASYAWFTLNGIVEATNMNVTTSALDGLLISNRDAPTEFASVAAASEVYTDSVINPSSTVDGLSFFTLPLINENGSPQTGPNNLSIAANQPLAEGVAHSFGKYADFVFYIKSASGENVDVYLESADVDTEEDLKPALRMAVLDGANDTVARFADAGNHTVYNVGGGQLFTGTNPLSAVGQTYVGDSNGYQTLTRGNKLFTANGTPHKIIIRVWVEGQDDKCVPDNDGQTLTLRVSFDSSADS